MYCEHMQRFRDYLTNFKLTLLPDQHPNTELPGALQIQVHCQKCSTTDFVPVPNFTPRPERPVNDETGPIIYDRPRAVVDSPQA